MFLDGKCIQFSECPEVQCQNNAYFDFCGVPKSCEHTCGNLGIMFKCRSQCQIGCFCNPGYVKTESEECVLEADCPSKHDFLVLADFARIVGKIYRL